jgi:hypothetical protein
MLVNILSRPAVTTASSRSKTKDTKVNKKLYLCPIDGIKMSLGTHKESNGCRTAIRFVTVDLVWYNLAQEEFNLALK